MTDIQVASEPAGLAENTTFAHYRIVSKIGSGGMGDVYKAYDTKLGRSVALKLLRPELLRNPDKVRRFVQEAHAASGLNHPGIVTIYEVDQWRESGAGEATHYIAMEYVDGESLRKYLRRPSDLAGRLELLVQVAEAMAKAHSAGVIHRDLKPDNIMVTRDRLPKIVDFGLAKLVQPEVLLGSGNDEAATFSLHASRDGMVLGTVGYMSPEQVEGKPVDHRSDIFSLGCILYECVTDRRAFESNSIVDSLHQIVYSQPPPVHQINPGASTELERIRRRCLAKDPDDRYQSIKEVAIELREVLRTNSAGAFRPPPRHRWQTIATLGAVAIVVAALAVPLLRPKTGNLGDYRFTPVATSPAYEGFPSWSPDGKSIVYVRDVDGTLQVFVRSLDSPMTTQITRAARDCRDPFWGPNGNRIYYVSLAGDRDSLWSVGVAGGSPEVVHQNVYAATISPDGKTLVLLREVSEPGNFNLSLWVASPPAAEPKPLKRPPVTDRNVASAVLRFAPDGRKVGLWAAIRYPAQTATGFYRAFWLIPFPSGDPKEVPLEQWTGGRPFPFSWLNDSRRIVFGADQVSATPGMHLWVADTSTGNVRPLTVSNVNEYYPAVSPDGKKIVFSSEEEDFDLISVSTGDATVKPLLATSRSEKEPAWSPAKGEFAYVTNESGNEEIWIRSEDGRWQRPVVRGRDFDDGPSFLFTSLAFSPDGQRIAYQRWGRGRQHVWISPVAGGPPVPLIPMSVPQRPYEDTPTWSPDGNWIAFTAPASEGGFGLWKIRVGAGSPPVLLKESIVYPSVPQWSPRGDWITVDTPEGLSLLNPDGADIRLLSEETWLAQVWASDGASVYGIRMTENLHLVLARIDIATGNETFLADLGQSPPIIQPVQGLSLSADGKTLLTSMARLRGDLWMLEGFSEPEGFLQKALSRLRS